MHPKAAHARTARALVAILLAAALGPAGAAPSHGPVGQPAAARRAWAESCALRPVPGRPGWVEVVAEAKLGWHTGGGVGPELLHRALDREEAARGAVGLPEGSDDGSGGGPPSSGVPLVSARVPPALRYLVAAGLEGLLVDVRQGAWGRAEWERGGLAPEAARPSGLEAALEWQGGREGSGGGADPALALDLVAELACISTAAASGAAWPRGGRLTLALAPSAKVCGRGLRRALDLLPCGARAGVGALVSELAARGVARQLRVAVRGGGGGGSTVSALVALSVRLPEAAAAAALRAASLAPACPLADPRGIGAAGLLRELDRDAVPAGESRPVPTGAPPPRSGSAVPPLAGPSLRARWRLLPASSPSDIWRPILELEVRLVGGGRPGDDVEGGEGGLTGGTLTVLLPPPPRVLAPARPPDLTPLAPFASARFAEVSLLWESRERTGSMSAGTAAAGDGARQAAAEASARFDDHGGVEVVVTLARRSTAAGGPNLPLLMRFAIFLGVPEASGAPHAAARGLELAPPLVGWRPDGGAAALWARPPQALLVPLRLPDESMPFNVMGISGVLVLAPLAAALGKLVRGTTEDQGPRNPPGAAPGPASASDPVGSRRTLKITFFFAAAAVAAFSAFLA